MARYAGKNVVRDRDFGMARLIAQMRRNGAVVHAGVPADKPRDGGGPSNLDVALLNEFGTSTIPERSFIRSTFDEQRPRIEAALRKLGQLAMRQGSKHDALLVAYGQFLVGLIRKKITDGVPPPNAQSTIDRKGSSKPLVDTGQLRKAITSWVTK